MQVSRAGEYGVLGLLHLVRQPPGSPVMIDAVSRGVGIPKSFLAKIFQDLTKVGILRSQRGSGGGFSLARPATEISVLEIIEAIEGKIALQRCLSEVPDCDKREDCALCFLFEEAQQRLKEIFGQTTLQELAVRQLRLSARREGAAAEAKRGREANRNGDATRVLEPNGNRNGHVLPFDSGVDPRVENARGKRHREGRVGGAPLRSECPGCCDCGHARASSKSDVPGTDFS